MRPSMLLALALLIAPAAALAGEIYGQIRDSGGPVTNTSVTVRCREGTYRARTDDSGSYSVYVDEQGTCRLSISYRGQTPSIGVASYAEPQRYNLLVSCAGGNCRLERR